MREERSPGASRRKLLESTGIDDLASYGACAQHGVHDDCDRLGITTNERAKVRDHPAPRCNT